MNKTTIAVAALAFLASATEANAATFAQTFNQTTSGQAFNFALNINDKPTGAGSLTFLARGDFSQNVTSESFSFRLENAIARSAVWAQTGNIITKYANDDVLFQTTFALTEDQLTNILSDNVVNISVQYSSAVGISLSPAPFITATVDFPTAAAAVPEPATWAMMLVGFGMVAGTARYRRRATKIAYA